MKERQYVYKCRLCGQLKGGAIGCLTDSDASVVLNEVEEKGHVGLLGAFITKTDFHSCKNGGFGIADLVGVRDYLPNQPTQPSDLAKIITERIATLEWSDTNYEREIAELKLILDLLKQHPYPKSMLQQRLTALCDGAKTVVHSELKKEYKYRIAEVSFLLDATE